MKDDDPITLATAAADFGVGFLGMTVKTFEAVYGHHSPDHQERAANI